MGIIRLRDEKDLIIRLKKDTLILIHASPKIEPIKRLVEASDILDLTLDINQRFPTVPPDLPICDEPALMRLREIGIELYLYHRIDIPVQHLELYGDKITALLTLFRLPRYKFD